MYAKEHYIAHKLLAEENKDNIKLLYAFGAMGQNNKGLRPKLTPEEYEKAKVAFIKAASLNNAGEKNPMYGVHRYGEANPNFGKKHPGMGTGSKNSMYGKHYKHTKETCLKIANKTTETWASYTEEEYKNRCAKVAGQNNGMYGKYGLSKRCVQVKCVETNEIYASILDAERKTGCTGIKVASKTGKTAGGYHWIRLNK